MDFLHKHATTSGFWLSRIVLVLRCYHVSKIVFYLFIFLFMNSICLILVPIWYSITKDPLPNVRHLPLSFSARVYTGQVGSDLIKPIIQIDQNTLVWVSRLCTFFSVKLSINDKLGWIGLGGYTIILVSESGGCCDIIH